MIPEIPKDEIARVSWVNQTVATFNFGIQHQTIVGGAQAGKSILLAQFAKQLEKSCICYFPDVAPVSLNIHHYLYSLCYQISTLVGKPEPKTDATFEELCRVYSALSVQLNEVASKKKEKYYYVIDGLEQFCNGLEGERIVDFFPPKLSANVYLLSSIFDGSIDILPKEKLGRLIPSPRFELIESISYLSEISISLEQKTKVHELCEGLPGYLKLVKDILKEDPNYDLSKAPKEIQKLASDQVEKLTFKLSNIEIEILKNLSAVGVSLPVKLLLNACDGSKQVNIANLIETGVAKTDPKKEYVKISSQLFREAFSVKYSLNRQEIARKLLATANDMGLEESEVINPLLKTAKDYQTIKTLLGSSSLTRAIEKSNTALSDINTRLVVATEIAAANNDVDDLVLWAGISLIRKSFQDHCSNIPELDALISLERFDLAIDRINSVPDAYVRVILLSKIYFSLKATDSTNESFIKNEIRSQLALLSLHKLDLDQIKDLALSLYSILPAEAGVLLDNTERKELDWNDLVSKTQDTPTNTIFDQEAFQGKFASLIKEHVGEDVLQKVHQIWLTTLTYDDLQSRLRQLKSTQSKEYLIRKWCESQNSNHHLLAAVDSWIGVVTDDAEFDLPVRSIRSITESIIKVEASPELCDLKNRLISQGKALLQVPREEWIRYKLALASLISKFDIGESIKTILETLNDLEAIKVDKDVIVYALASSWLTLNKIDPNSAQIAVVRSQFQKELEQLLASSADHLELLGKTISVLSEIDVEFSLIVANELNTRERRAVAISEIVKQVIAKQHSINFSDVVSDAVQYLFAEDREFGEIILRASIRLLMQSQVVISKSNLEFLFMYANECHNNSLKALMLTELYVLATQSKLEIDKLNFDLIYQTWERENNLANKIAVGYDIVSRMVKISVESASNLFHQVEQLALSSDGALARGELGAAYQWSIEEAIRSLSIEELNNSKQVLNTFDKYIEHVLAPHVRAVMYAKLASRFITIGSDDLGRHIISKKIVPNLKLLASSLDYERAVVFCAPLLFDLDDHLALEILQTISITKSQIALQNSVIWQLTHYYLDGPMPRPVDLKQTCDIKRFRNALKFLALIKFDEELYTAIQALSKVVQNSYLSEDIDRTQAFDILQSTEQIIHRNLPDKGNFQHNGYVVLSRAEVLNAETGLYQRLHAESSARGLSSRDILQKWDLLIQLGEAIPNLADRVFVETQLANNLIFPARDKTDRQLSKRLNDLAKNLLTTARGNINQIPTLFDRCDRLYYVAESWANLFEKTEAETILDELYKLSDELRYASQDEIKSLCIQTAYKVNPDFAVALSKKIKSRNSKLVNETVDTTLLVKRLIQTPSAIEVLTCGPSEIDSVVYQAVHHYLIDIASGKSFIPQQKHIASWVERSQQCRPETIRMVIGWSNELLQASSKKSRSSNYLAFLDLADTAWNFSQVITPNQRRTPIQVSNGSNSLRPVHVFEQGDNSDAANFIKTWLQTHCRDYVRICDPYFSVDQIFLLSYIPQECNVAIVTTDQKLKIDTQSDRDELIRQLRIIWSQTSSHTIPATTIYIVDKSSEGSFHDRVITTNGYALQIGPSINGLGNQIGSITELSQDDANNIETQYVEERLSYTFWIKKGIRPVILQM
jgi:hypothetical protein